MAEPQWGSLPFREQIQFFLQKLDLPTATWRDIWQSAHDRAFVVAGAMKADLISDLRMAVQKGIDQGTTLEEFRKDFEAIVKAHGWTGWTGEGTKAGRAWRTRVIYETNLRTSYAAGRWAQLKAAGFPYLRYKHNDNVMVPRPAHLALDGRIFRADDPFWQRAAPPNGFGCFLAGTEVATPQGWRPIESLRYADAVYGGSGEVQSVTAPQCRQFDGDVIRVATEQGEVTATPNHRFLTMRGWIRAEHLKIGEVLVQVPEIAPLYHPVVDVKHADAGARELFVPVPVRMLDSPGREALDSDLDAGDVDVNPVRSDVMVVSGGEPPRRQRAKHDVLTLCRGRFGVGMGRRVGRVTGPLSLSHLCADTWAPRRRGYLELFRRAAHAFVRLFRLPETIVPPGSRLRERDLAQDFGRLSPALVVVGPLRLDRIGARPGHYSARRHELDDRAVADLPSPTDRDDRLHLFDVTDPEGFVDGAPLDRFDALADFARWAFVHARSSIVTGLSRQGYSGKVYNLSVTKDESYCLRVGVVHNCKCWIEGVSAREMTRLGKAGPDTPPTDWAADEGWNYAPGANAATPWRDLIDRKLFSLDAPIGASMWERLKGVVADELRRALADMVGRVSTTLRANGESLLVAGLAPATVADLARAHGVDLESAGVWLRDHDLLHALRGGKEALGHALPAEVWRDLPRLLEEATPYLDTLDRALVFVFDAPNGTGKVVVRVNYSEKVRRDGKRERITANFVRTGGVIAETDVRNSSRYIELVK